MRKLRILLLTILSICFMLVLTGCRCDPSEHKWYIERFAMNTVYANGVEQVEVYDGIPDIDDPFGGMENGIVDIQFFEDGKVTFKPGTGEVLTGTYTLKHNGFKDTDFTVTLDNGETFSGNGGSFLYETILNFSFRDMYYNFEKAYQDAEEIYQEHMSYMPDHIRRHVDSGYLMRSTVSYNDGVYSLTEKNGDSFLLDENVTVKCVRLDEEDMMAILDSIEEGKCFSRIEKNSNGKSTVVIYYVEPFPEEPPEPTEPEPLMLYEYESQLAELDAENITEIKFTKEFTNLPPGYTRYHQYITDAEQIKDILSLLKNIELTKASERFEPNEQAEKLTLHIYTDTGDFMFTTIGGIYWRDNSDGYTLSEFPEFTYDGAVRSFLDGLTYIAHAYYGEEDLGTIICPWLSNIEFVVDTEEHDYAPSSPYWTYVFDFGEITVYDETHFRYNGQNYVVVGDRHFSLTYAD